MVGKAQMCQTDTFDTEREKLISELNAELKERGLQLEQRPEGLTLTDGRLSMRGDFVPMIPRLKQSALKGEMLVKAAKVKTSSDAHTLIDATAGLGEDSLILAAAGFEVTMYERDRVIAALLADCLKRALKEPALSDIVSRMAFVEGNSIDELKTLPIRPDVIFLDPMFPERMKSALVKKKFQLLHRLEKPCPDEEELLQAAVSARPGKIVIKRPSRGNYLAGRKPSYSISGKTVRYDCIVFP